MLKLDHVVYFTKKSPIEIVKEQNKKGHHAVVGGSHEKWGTYNALMYKRNAYVEWLSVEHKEIAEQANHPLTAQLLHDEEGWGTICFSVEHIEIFEKEVKERGFHTSGVLSAERKTLDGQVRKWKMLFIEESVSDRLPMPFFIEWEDAEDVRFERLRADGTIRSTNMETEIKKCIFGVNGPEKRVLEWAKLLSVEVHNNQIILPNVILEFLEKAGKERLSDVLIEKF